jgi:hypothetical protein
MDTNNPQTPIRKPQGEPNTFRYKTVEQKAIVQKWQNAWNTNYTDTMLRIIEGFDLQATQGEIMRPCDYRTIVKDHEGRTFVLCAETHKIPLEACLTRQRRYEKVPCEPIGQKVKTESGSEPWTTPRNSPTISLATTHDDEDNEGEENNRQDDDVFDCRRLCKTFPRCTNNAMNSLGEVLASHCYRTKYPYKWKTPDGKIVSLCPFMVFRTDSDDPSNPYPQCIAKQTDVPFRLPKNQIITDPQICWNCYKTRKAARKEREKQREQQSQKMMMRRVFQGQPRIDWGDSAGVEPSFV